MAKHVSAFLARTRFGEILDAVRYRKEPYVVERNRRPVAAILDIEAFWALEARMLEDRFIEEYTDERIAAFLKEDKLEERTARVVSGRLKRAA